MKPLEYKKKAVKGMCTVLKCTYKTHLKKCNSCRSRANRIADPVRYAFHNLKNRAKQRGKVFTLSLADFRLWCIKVSYVGYAGKGKHSFTIDRIDNIKGYEISNIHILTRRENIKKYFSYDYRTKAVMFQEAQIDNTPNYF